VALSEGGRRGGRGRLALVYTSVLESREEFRQDAKVVQMIVKFIREKNLV
jgi:hypothetical protein